jgi:hypothetical protein
MIKVIVPTELNDITLGQLQRYTKLTEGVEDQDVLRQTMLSVFCDLDIKHYDKIHAQHLKEICEGIESVLNTKPRLERFFTLDGVKMAFIPNLDEITMGEYVDLENVGHEVQGWHELMCILFRPLVKTFGNRYDIENYKGYDNASQYKQMPLGVALGAMLFFWTLGSDLIADTLKSLKEVERDAVLRNHLLKNGLGLAHFTDSLKGISADLMRSQLYPYTLASIGLHMKPTYSN